MRDETDPLDAIFGSADHKLSPEENGMLAAQELYPAEELRDHWPTSAMYRELMGVFYLSLGYRAGRLNLKSDEYLRYQKAAFREARLARKVAKADSARHDD